MFVEFRVCGEKMQNMVQNTISFCAFETKSTTASCCVTRCWVNIESYRHVIVYIYSNEEVFCCGLVHYYSH